VRQLIIDKVAEYWHDSLEEIFDIKLEQVSELSDQKLLELFMDICELGI
jgi:hypothetical protein